MTCADFDRINELLFYNPETGKLYWKVSRSGTNGVWSEAGWQEGYNSVEIDGKSYYAHRVAHLLMTGHWPEGNPEHENLIKSDNRWSNIKDLATKSQNHGHRGIQRNNTSGMKGVSWNKQFMKWIVYIRLRGIRIHLGLFDDLREAGLTYDAAAKIAWGLRFSCLNFPAEESDHIVLSERVLSKLLA